MSRFFVPSRKYYREIRLFRKGASMQSVIGTRPEETGPGQQLIATEQPTAPENLVPFRPKKVRLNRSTLVETLVVLAGNFGGNNALMYMSGTRPDEVPGIELLNIDTDGPILNDRFFSVKRKNLDLWNKFKRFKVIQLRSPKEEPKEPSKVGEEPAAEVRKALSDVPDYLRHRKLFGAGGSPIAGRRAVETALSEIETRMERKDLVILWVGGCGGTGTAVAELVLELTEKKGIPLITLLATPNRKDGKKTSICAGLRKKLRTYGRVFVFHNSYAPAEALRLTRQNLYRVINEANQVVFRLWVELTQFIGDGDNADYEDVLTAAETGPDMYCGAYDVDQKNISGDALPEFNAPAIGGSIM